MTAGDRVLILFNRFEELAAKLNAEAIDAVSETAREIETDIKASAPSDRIPRSVIVRRPGTRTQIVAVGDLRRGSMHAGLVEYGTADRAGTPFVTPAAERARPAYMRRMRGLLDRGL